MNFILLIIFLCYFIYIEKIKVYMYTIMINKKNVFFENLTG